MSNIIPPLLSDTPPPPPEVDDQEEDEFGDFTGTNNLSYDFDESFSSPPESPLQLPTESYELDGPELPKVVDVNSNSKQNDVVGIMKLEKLKDFHDKRKECRSDLIQASVNNHILNETEDPESNIVNGNTVIPRENSPLPLIVENPKLPYEITETNCDSNTTSRQSKTTNLTESFSICVDDNDDDDDKIFNKFKNFSEATVNNDSSASCEGNISNKVLDHNIKDPDLENRYEIESSKTIDNLELWSNSNKAEEMISNKITNTVIEPLSSLKHSVNTSNLPEASNSSNDRDKNCFQICEETHNSQITADTATLPNGLFLENNCEALEDDLPFESSNGSCKNSFDNFVNAEEVEPTPDDIISKSEENCQIIEDDFGDFVSTKTAINECNNSSIAVCPSNENFQTDDFHQFPEANYKKFEDNKDEQEFANFACFSEPLQTNVDVEDDDDFGDFATTSVMPQNQLPTDDKLSKLVLLNEKQAFEKSTVIIKDMFPSIEQTLSDFEQKHLEANDKVFSQIKNIFETHALAYQWPKSLSQKLLLKSLNIDLRNILHGVAWNSSMPRFAATLSATPLQPIKSEVLSPAAVKDMNPSITSHPEKLDKVKLELNDEVLSDPCEDLEQLMSQFDNDNFKKPMFSYNLNSPIKECNSWETWLESISSKEPPSAEISQSPLQEGSSIKPGGEILLPVNAQSLQASKIDLEQPSLPIIHNDFDDFVSGPLKPNQEALHHGHNIILRETHITNHNSKDINLLDESDIVSWLEPTIVTPELMRKEREFVEPEEEFDDFQMVVVKEEQTCKPIPNLENLIVKPLENNKLQLIDNLTNQTGEELGIFKQSLADYKSQRVEKNQPINAITKVSVEDDEFGDFTYSLPKDNSKKLQTNIETGQVLSHSTLLEPMKPSVLQPQNVQSSAISWPDPGITDDEISRFEALGHSRRQSKETPNNGGLVSEPNTKSNISNVAQNNSVSRKGSLESSSLSKTKTSKQSPNHKQISLDEDEWSDFVSVQNSSPVHKLKTGKERSSTPDLPLSVLNLGSVQPTKQPIPVITPNGLVQTRLSSNMSLNFPNMAQPTNRIYQQPQVSANPVYQPSIISNQYANQAYAGFSNYKQQSFSKPDDDEWSDFVSHKPTTVKKNTQSKFEGLAISNQPNQLLSGWMNTTPNIITNPAASFGGFDSSSGQKQVKKSTGANKKSAAMPNMSMPDLDFLAPKNRTAQRK